MTQATVTSRAPLSTVTAVDTAIDTLSGVSWAAVFAGAFVAAAFSLALVALGAGIGLVSVSPWSSNNPSVTTFTVLAAAWFIAVQLFAYGVGGYIAGRLRGGWARVHTDEVFFRDTAHGLLVWAVGAVIAAALLASAASSAVSGAAKLAGAASEAVGSATGQAAGQAASTMGDPTAYFSDMLWRSDKPAQGDQAAATAEGGRIMSRALYNGDLPAGDRDKTYLAQLVASRTGMSQPDAEKRVTDVFDQAQKAKQQAVDKAKEAAEAARKTGVGVALWAFISLLVGAFSASYMATVGGRQRDEAPLYE
ncbi:MAG TPA: hypothetical protein VNY10_01240 [Roseiarcus sp.]|nr:hypothetical protein [Roseiarcus sp.]